MAALIKMIFIFITLFQLYHTNVINNNSTWLKNDYLSSNNQSLIKNNTNYIQDTKALFSKGEISITVFLVVIIVFFIFILLYITCEKNTCNSN